MSKRLQSLFSNTLVLPGFDALEATKIDDPKKLDSVKQTLILRGRHLESAVFDNADLRKADFSGSQLQDASLTYAQLQGASLESAQLQGASLAYAQLQGASLIEARLQGASLAYAQLQGASLESAQLQGATLTYAQLQGASLIEAQLQGASLGATNLQGATLESAQLQGANFQESTLIGTNMSDAAVWRTNFEHASLTAIFEDGVKESAPTKDYFAALQAMIMKEVPEGKGREQTLKRIEILNTGIFGPEASEQETLEKGRVEETAYRSALADQLESLACSNDEAALVIVRGLFQLNFKRLEAIGTQAPGLIEAILYPKAAQNCPVSAALTEADRAALLAKEARPIRKNRHVHPFAPPG